MRRSSASTSASDSGSGRLQRGPLGRGDLARQRGGGQLVERAVPDRGQQLIFLRPRRADMTIREVHREPPLAGTRRSDQLPLCHRRGPAAPRRPASAGFRDAHADRSLMPERFRGGCPFGAPRWQREISPGRHVQRPRAYSIRSPAAGRPARGMPGRSRHPAGRPLLAVINSASLGLAACGPWVSACGPWVSACGPWVPSCLHPGVGGWTPTLMITGGARPEGRVGREGLA